MIRSNFQIEENRNSTIEQANKMGAMALFGEKYGDKVRVIKFGNSIELCGGTHVSATGNIGIIKITSESAIAAGIRRIEAITGEIAENYFRKEITTINNISDIFKGSKNIIGSIEKLISDNVELSKKIELFNKENAKQIKNFLKTKIQTINGANLIAENIKIDSAESVKDISYQLKSEIENLILIIGAEINEKPLLSIMISDNLVASKNINASKIVRDAAVEINGGGGGQAFYATAGGKNINGLLKSINKAKELVLL
jgi:alanyl-tRNA synthetase